MKVSQLIKILESHDPDADVYYTWESIGGPVEAESIYLAKGGAVIIDCDNNFYQDEIQTDGAYWIDRVTDLTPDQTTHQNEETQ